MNQGKLEVIKQMARMDNILGISAVSGSKQSSLIQMTIIYTTVDKNLLEKMESPS